MAVTYSMVLFRHSDGLYGENVRVRCDWVIREGPFKMQSTYSVTARTTEAEGVG
jgi:hypothetical protein